MSSEMKGLSEIFNDFLSEEPIIIYKRIYAEMFGSIGIGLLFGALAYWAKTMKYGQFYKTDKALCEETGMKIDQLRAAKKKLVELGVFSIEVKSLPARTYYQIHLDKILNLIKKHATKKRKPVRVKSANKYTENPQTGCGNDPNQYRGNPHTTSETKAEINTETNTKTNRAREAAPEIKAIQQPKAEPSIGLTTDSVCEESVLEEKIPNEKPEPKAAVPRPAKTNAVSKQEFELFWLAYALKVGKGAAVKAFASAMNKTSLEAILLAIEAQKSERAERERLGLWNPSWKHPSTWLNKECWNDAPKTSDELQKEAEVKRIGQHPASQKKPNYSDRVEAANRATGNIIEKFYPDLAKYFPMFAPEPNLTDFNIPQLCQEVVINAI